MHLNGRQPAKPKLTIKPMGRNTKKIVKIQRYNSKSRKDIPVHIEI